MAADNREPVLITGATGFVGSYLAALCAQQGWLVHGTTLSQDSGTGRATEHVDHLHVIDLTNLSAVTDLVSSIKPTRIFHLAAQASVQLAWQDPIATLHNNIDAQFCLLEAVRTSEVAARTLIISSSEVYGKVTPAGMHVTEQQALAPLDPYAVSKVTQEMLGLQYANAFDMPIVRVRPFNHMGPRQRSGFVAADFARQIASIESGKTEPVIHVGNLEAIRDLSDVRDVVRAYVDALEYGDAGDVYNVSSGLPLSMQALLDKFIELSPVPITVMRDDALYRPIDRPCIVGDSSKLRAQTGWQSTIPIETTIHDTLEFWRESVSAVRA